MRTRILLCTGIVLCLVGTLHAQTTWSGPSGGLWSDPANWSAGLPDSADKVYFDGPSVCILDFEGAETKNIDCAGGPLQIVDGGSLRTYDWFIMGYGVGDVGELAGRVEVYDGGVLNSGVRFYVGREGEGYLTVYEGGTVNLLSQNLQVAQTATGVGVLTMEGGVINILEGSDAWGLRHVGDASIDFRGGTIMLRDSPGAVELSWTLPDPCVPGQPVPVDVYFTDDLTALQQFTDPAAMQVVNNQNVTSVVVQTQAKTRYYWAVDTYIGSAQDPVFGPIFSFLADNLPPVVDAGADVVTWLEDGSRTVNLDTTVTDQDAVTVQWTVVSGPDAAPIDIQITDGGNDAEQHVDDGSMDIGSSDLEIAYEDAGDPAKDEQVVALRFVGVPLENGALVANAYVEVEVDKVDKQGSQAPVNLIIEGELAPDAAPFENVANNITDRAVTTAQVKWSIPAWTEKDAKFQTPDISSIIMEINSQGYWASGNAIVLILRDDKDNPSTGLREAESSSGEAAAAPLLHIDLAGGPVVIETPTAEDTNVILSLLGEHVLQLDAFDGEYTGSDTVAINVYSDGCEAAKSLPDYEPSPGDLNGDCIVDDLDLAILQEDWLKDTSLTEEIRLD